MDSALHPPNWSRATANAFLVLAALGLGANLWIQRSSARSTGDLIDRVGPLLANHLRAKDDILRGGLAVPPISFLAQVPAPGTMDYPLGSEAGALTYNARPFREVDHLGDDLNGIGGQNSDLGDPVFAAADGLVLFAGDAGGGWGNVVLLQHRDANGNYVQTFYGHLDTIGVRVGDLAPRGTRVGTVGTAHGQYYAHLHFEVRRGFRLDLGSGYSPFALNRENPEWILRNQARPAPSRLHPAPGSAGVGGDQ